MERSLLDLLRDGGNILYARHGEATVGEDLPNLNFKDCLSQRNLSEKGRGQALYYGEILRSLQIPVNYPIITSPFCRAIETAQLAFGRENVQVDLFWAEIYRLSSKLSDKEQNRILTSLQSALEIKPPKGSNRVIIGHSFPQWVGLGQIPNMGTVVVRPLGQGAGYKIISRLSLANLARML